jgi:D-aspartate ligase
MEASWANGLGIIRGLAEHRLHSLALDHSHAPLGFASRYATGMTCPDPGREPDAFGEFLLALGKALPQKGVLLITHDTYLTEVAKREHLLAPYFYFSFPSWSDLQQVMDKKVQCETALAEGIATPKTLFLDETPPDQIDADALAWPAILKGRSGKSLSRAVGRQVIIVHSLDEVKRAYQAFGELGLMLQEIIAGGDEQLVTFGSCLDRSGELLASFTGRKLRQHPAGFGTALAAESLDLPEVAEQSTRLLRALKFFGPSQVEFKLDPADGRFKLMEINARFWKWHNLATACGANVAYATYSDAIGRPCEPQIARNVHKVWIVSTYDLIMTSKRIRRGDYTLRRWLETTRIPWVDAILSWHDPAPGLQLFRKLRRDRASRRHRQTAEQGQQRQPQGLPVGVTEAIARPDAFSAERKTSIDEDTHRPR